MNRAIFIERLYDESRNPDFPGQGKRFDDVHERLLMAKDRVILKHKQYISDEAYNTCLSQYLNVHATLIGLITSNGENIVPSKSFTRLNEEQCAPKAEPTQRPEPTKSKL